MTSTEGLIARLRKDVFYGDERLHNMARHNPLHMEAADTLEAAQAEIEKLSTENARVRVHLVDLSAQYTSACRTIDQIAAERDALRAENDRLRGSLRKIEVGLDFIAADDITEDARMAARLLPIARAALAKGGE